MNKITKTLFLPAQRFPIFLRILDINAYAVSFQLHTFLCFRHLEFQPKALLFNSLSHYIFAERYIMLLTKRYGLQFLKDLLPKCTLVLVKYKEKSVCMVTIHVYVLMLVTNAVHRGTSRINVSVVIFLTRHITHYLHCIMPYRYNTVLVGKALCNNLY